MIIEINVLVDCSDLQPSLIVNLKTMISDARSICDEENTRTPGGGVGSWETIHFRNLSPPPESGSLSQDKGSHDLSTFATFAG